MKFTFEDKLEMNELWKNKHWSSKMIATQYRGTWWPIHYMLHLMDRHGVGIINHDKNMLKCWAA